MSMGFLGTIRAKAKAIVEKGILSRRGFLSLRLLIGVGLSALGLSLGAVAFGKSGDARFSGEKSASAAIHKAWFTDWAVVANNSLARFSTGSLPADDVTPHD